RYFLVVHGHVDRAVAEDDFSAVFQPDRLGQGDAIIKYAVADGFSLHRVSALMRENPKLGDGFGLCSRDHGARPRQTQGERKVLVAELLLLFPGYEREHCHWIGSVQRTAIV